MTTPDLTPERLAEIRARDKAAIRDAPWPWKEYITDIRQDVRDLLAAIEARDAEIERLRRRCSEALHCVSDNNMSSAYRVLKTVGEAVNAG